ncbi:xylulokinase [Vibrio sp. S12_S33]|uniref:xylulokinase n=1 Tax=Vibrio sp. S12_S33 TaxID=2720223 RepID=UPI00177E9C3B|nr:xylulokinase [Vibrio sp. S12_S33]MBD1566507.1 xylulokinase [Vibrio sp. S12_S33]
MFIGIDLGTSGVKVVLLDDKDIILGSETSALSVCRPYPLWSEQSPQDWWQATDDAIVKLGQIHDLSKVQAIGLSGQMHGATLLDQKGEVLRPAILWNDGRSFEACQLLEKMVPESRDITGNIMMPGFTAPKIKWLQRNEPDCFKKIAKVLLPKDYIRFRLSGDYATDMSDAAGTMWLDVAKRDWSDVLLQATGLTREHMPRLFEGNQVTGVLKKELANKWGLMAVPIVAGAGDNAAGAIGVGITRPGQAMLSLGTSGVYFAVSEGVAANPDFALHSFCHALPNVWHSMSVILSAASCISWVAQLIGIDDVSQLLDKVEAKANPDSNVVFLPYLSGERTPHNDPNAKGVFFGMTHNTDQADLGLAVLEGVGFALADGMDALYDAGETPDEITLIGGGAKSQYWRQMLADILGQTLTYRAGGEVGPALGAARLARLAMSNATPISDICPVPVMIETHYPDSDKHFRYQEKRVKYQALYQSLKTLF